MDEKEAEARPVMGTIFLVYFCMKFEVTTMLPVKITAVKRRLLN